MKIIHLEAGIVIEEAEDSPSPYLNVDTGIYGGPTQYFKKDKMTKSVQHTITGTRLDESAVKDRIALCTQGWLD